MKYTKAILLGLFLMSWAVADNYGLPGDYLIELYPSATALAVGGGSIALCDNTDGMYLNPACLGKLGYMEFSATYQRIFEGFNFFTAPFAYPFGKYGTLGIYFASLNSPETQGYDEWGIERGGMYTSTDNTVIFAYGKQFLGKYSLGANLKLDAQKIDAFSDMGVGFDLGAQAAPLSWLSLGLAVVNLGGPTLTLDGEPESFSTTLRSGIGLTFLERRLGFYADVDVMELTADENQYESGDTGGKPIRYRSGVEYWLYPYFAVRTGINDRMFTGGIGFKLKGTAFDYGLGYHRDDTELNNGFVHAFTLRFQFGKPVPKQEEEIAVKNREADLRLGLQRGQQAFVAGRPREAQKLIAEYVKAHPGDKDAMAFLKEVESKLASGDVRNLVDKALGEMQKKNYAQAETLVTQALLILPSSEEANKIKQRLMVLKENQKRIESIGSLYAQKRYGDMAKEIAVVLSLDSANAEALDYRAKIREFTSRQEADQHYALASKLYYEDKDAERANAELQKALEIMPDHKEAKALYEKLGNEIKEIYLKKVGQMVDKKGLAVDNKDLKKLIALDVQDKIIAVRKLVDEKQFVQALAELDAILRDAPKNEQALTLRDKALEGQKKEKADVIYGEALKLFNEKRTAEAEARAMEAVALFPLHQKAQALLNDIRLQRRKENLDAAEKKMASGARDDLEAARKMVEDYLAVDQTSERGQALLRQIEAELHVGDAKSYIENGDYEKADQAIQKALKLDPGNKDAQDAFKNLKEAREALGE